MSNVANIEGVPSLTEFQQAVLRWYLKHRLFAFGGVTDPLWLALVAAGDRKGAWVSNVGLTVDHSPDELEQWLESLGIAYQRTGSAPEATIQRGTDGYLITPTPSRFGMLPPSDAPRAEYQRQMGEFLDYPAEAIDAHVEGRAASNSKLQVDVRRGVVSVDEIGYLTFVPYSPPRSIASYERAIATGKRTAARLNALAEIWELPSLETFVERCYHQHCERYTPTEPTTWIDRARRWIEEKTTPVIEEHL